MRRKILFFLSIMAVVITVGALASHWAYRAGEAQANQEVQRLDLVFGNVLALPERDRLLLAVLSSHCKLHTRPPVRNETIHCLRGAAAAPALRLPKSLTNPVNHLDKLLVKIPAPHAATWPERS
jgi:hypothetical protein